MALFSSAKMPNTSTFCDKDVSKRPEFPEMCPKFQRWTQRLAAATQQCLAAVSRYLAELCQLAHSGKQCKVLWQCWCYVGSSAKWTRPSGLTCVVTTHSFSFTKVVTERNTDSIVLRSVHGQYAQLGNVTPQLGGGGDWKYRSRKCGSGNIGTKQ